MYSKRRSREEIVNGWSSDKTSVDPYRLLYTKTVARIKSMPRHTSLTWSVIRKWNSKALLEERSTWILEMNRGGPRIRSIADDQVESWITSGTWTAMLRLYYSYCVFQQISDSSSILFSYNNSHSTSVQGIFLNQWALIFHSGWKSSRADKFATLPFSVIFVSDGSSGFFWSF